MNRVEIPDNKGVHLSAASRLQVTPSVVPPRIVTDQRQEDR
jgi:hypothetical protein